jgi:hypothetical protein
MEKLREVMGFGWNWVKPRVTVTTDALLSALLELVRAAMQTRPTERERLETGSQQRPQLLVPPA